MAAAAGPTPYGANNSSGPGMGAFNITPHNTNMLTATVRCIYVGGTGNLNMVCPDGTTVLFSALPVGIFVPVCAVQVLATLTTASLLVGIV